MKKLAAGFAALSCGVVWSLGCASTSGGGSPLQDPGSEATRLRAATGVAVPYEIRLRWEYGDEQGRLRGDGLARVNPPDSFRLDLFTAGEGSMAAVLVDDSLSTLGQIEDVELPAAGFLYAMAGLFRPDDDARLVAGSRTPEGSALEYEGAGGRRRLFRFEDDRLVAVEERLRGELARRIRIVWREGGAWPGTAEYRDLETPRRVQWRLERAEARETPYPASIFRLEPDG